MSWQNKQEVTSKHGTESRDVDFLNDEAEVFSSGSMLSPSVCYCLCTAGSISDDNHHEDQQLHQVLLQVTTLCRCHPDVSQLLL